jgi:hypothetical protein
VPIPTYVTAKEFKGMKLEQCLTHEFAFERLVDICLLHIWEVSVSNSVSETGILTELFRFFPQSLLINAGLAP